MSTIDWNAPAVPPVEGKWAKLRNGETRGPMKRHKVHDAVAFPMFPDGDDTYGWDAQGRYIARGYYKPSPHARHANDIIAILDAPQP